MKKIIFTFLLVLVFALPVHAAEMVTIENVSKDDVYNQVLTSAMKIGLTVQENSDYSLIFRENIPNLNFSAIWGVNAYMRHIFNFAQLENDVLLSHELQVVSGQRISPLTKENIPLYLPSARSLAEQGYAATLDTLKYIKGHFNKMYQYGLGIALEKRKNAIEILDVLPNSPADKAGIIKGDKIISFDSQSVKNTSYKMFDAIISRNSLDKKTLTIEIQRGKDILKFSLEPQYIP